MWTNSTYQKMDRSDVSTRISSKLSTILVWKTTVSRMEARSGCSDRTSCALLTAVYAWSLIQSIRIARKSNSSFSSTENRVSYTPFSLLTSTVHKFIAQNQNYYFFVHTPSISLTNVGYVAKFFYFTTQFFLMHELTIFHSPC